MIETSQTGGNGSVNIGVSPCIISEQRTWVGHKCRRMLASEGLRLQGLYMPDSIVQKFDADSSNIMRLAGNAFNAVCCQSSVIAIWVVLGNLHYKRQLQSLQQVVLPHISFESSSSSSSDEAEHTVPTAPDSPNWLDLSQ